MTVWAATQKYRKENHLRIERLRRVYLESGAHAAVKNAVQGSSSAGIRGVDSRVAEQEALDEGVAATEDEHVTLRGKELKEALDAEERRKKERQLADRAALDGIYAYGTWRCNRCYSAISPKHKGCPNFVRVKSNKIAKFGSAKFAPCGGSQVVPGVGM